jgi:NADPH2:quinone reductase
LNLKYQIKSGPYGPYIQTGSGPKNIKFHKITGGIKPEDITLEDCKKICGSLKTTKTTTKKDEVIVQNKAIGINFFDHAFRSGQYKLNKFPAILGLEASGVIVALGSEVKDFKLGDRVAYVNAGIGAYAERKAVNVYNLIPVPSDITDEQVASCLLKGLMAHTLLHRVYIASLVKKILIHSVAGGVGHILCQWAKYLNIEIIGTVGSDDKMDYARSIGCSYVINYKTQNLVEEVAKITNHEGVGVVYDGVGKDTLEKSLECLWPMGMCVSFGEASGNTDKLDLNYLVTNSLYLTRPTLALYKANRIELVLSAAEVFAAMEQGILLSEALEKFNIALSKTKFIVGQNVGFDVNIMGCEFHRMNIGSDMIKMPVLDTCTEITANLLKLPGGRGGKFKLPTLISGLILPSSINAICFAKDDSANTSPRRGPV